MAVNTLALIPFILVLLLFVAIPILMGIYVYRDAEERGMNGLLWALVAIFVPGFLGLVIYLLARNDRVPGYGCPSCGNAIEEGYEVCPNCGYQLTIKCSGCDRNVPKQWKLCAWCGQELPESRLDNIVINRNSGNKKILIIIIISIIILIMFALMGLVAGNFFYMSSSSNNPYTGTTEGSEWDNGFSYSFNEITGKEIYTFPARAGKTTTLTYNTRVEKGKLSIKIIDSNGKVVKKINKEESGTFDVETSEYEDYIIEIATKRATGYYSIKWDAY